MIQDTVKPSNASLAYLFLRATLGVNILFHGVARLLGGPGHFASALVHQFQATPLPHSLVLAFGSTLPWAEVFLGLFILIGLFTRIALSLGALLILALTVGTCLLQNWPVAGDQLVYAAVYAALLAFLSANRFHSTRFFVDRSRNLRKQHAPKPPSPLPPSTARS